MENLNEYRIIITGLVSYKTNIEEALLSIKQQISRSGGTIVGQLIQRRGVSRNNGPGGSKNLNKPLNPKTYIGSGKTDELNRMTKNLDCNLILFINDISESQKRNIEEIVNIKVDVIQPEI